jgi:hypothetical protein
MVAGGRLACRKHQQEAREMTATFASDRVDGFVVPKLLE